MWVVVRSVYGEEPPGTAVCITMYTWTTHVSDGLRPSSRRGSHSGPFPLPSLFFSLSLPFAFSYKTMYIVALHPLPPKRAR